MIMNSLFYKPKIANNILELIGGTPMIKLNKYNKTMGVLANILLKLEMYEPSFSIKDRTVLSIIEEAEKRGDIMPGKTTIIESTSGNTGISLAMICAVKGYKCIITTPYSTILDKRLLMSIYGAEIIYTPIILGMIGAIDKANEIYSTIENGFLLNQFENLDGLKIHKEKTGPEIWYQTDGNVDILIGAIGTGITMRGIYEYLKQMNPNLKIIAVEPAESAVLSGEEPSNHSISGIGAGFIPPLVKIEDFDEIYKVKTEDAITVVNDLIKLEGINLGFSSGATLAAAIDIGKRSENINKNIVMVVSSSGERYLNSSLFSKNYINLVHNNGA